MLFLMKQYVWLWLVGICVGVFVFVFFSLYGGLVGCCGAFRGRGGFLLFFQITEFRRIVIERLKNSLARMH